MFWTSLSEQFELEREESFRIICSFLLAYNSHEYVDKKSIESVKRALEYLEEDFKQDLLSQDHNKKDICRDIIKTRQILISFTKMNSLIDRISHDTVTTI
jgi:hypothetical protein